VKSKLF